MPSTKLAAEKLRIQAGDKVRVVNPPENLPELVAELPEGVLLFDQASTNTAPVGADVLLLFAQDRASLEASLPQAPSELAPQGILWVLYHKGTSSVQTDINRDSINAYAQTLGWQGVAMVSVTDDWSALRLKGKGV